MLTTSSGVNLTWESCFHFKKIFFPSCFCPFERSCFLYNTEKTSFRHQLSLLCPKIHQAIQLRELRQLFLNIHLISVPTCRRRRGCQCLPQDTLLLEGGEGNVSVVTDLCQAIEAADTGTGGYVKNQESYACIDRAIFGDGQTTAVPVKA